MKKWSQPLVIHMTAAFLGAMLALAFAPYEIFPFALLSLAGLLVLWLKATPSQGFWRGFSFGLGLFGAGIYWVYISIHLYGDVPPIGAAAIAALLIAVLALFPGTVGYLLNRYFSAANPAKMLLAFPAFWVLSEYLRTLLFTGFPWLLVGYSQTNSPLKGLASFVGVYGISLAVLVSSGLLVSAVLAFRKKLFLRAYLNLLGLTGIWTLSAFLNLVTFTHPTGNTMDVSLVQGNIPQSLKWSPDHIQLSFDRYESMTEPLWGPNKLIIWPEAAIPLPLDNARDFINEMDQKARENQSHLILGIPIKQQTSDNYYNAIITVGQGRHVYLKRRLVPFGEYVPLVKIFGRVFDFMNVPMSNMTPAVAHQEPFELNHVKIWSSICYEVAYPEFIRLRDASIGLLLTVTNDAWFGQSSAQAQHLQMAMMRALELQRPLLFASNDGITAIIDPHGNVQAEAKAHTATVLNGRVQPVSGMTPWMFFGTDIDVFISICMLLVAFQVNPKTLFLSYFRRFKRQEKVSAE